MRRLTHASRLILMIGLICVGGCSARRPDFMTRVAEDCATGDKWACDLIDALNRPTTTDEMASTKVHGQR
jgi:hypothetical protein